jgi:transcription initiation factor TFIIB
MSSYPNDNSSRKGPQGGDKQQQHGSAFNVALRLKYEQRCEDCGESDFVEDHACGDLICRSCGRVAESHVIDERSEWRTFSDKDKEGADPNRVGGPTNALLKDGGLSTMISGGKGVDKGLANNLQRMQARTDTSGDDKTLVMAFRDISRVCSSMKLPDVVRHQANEYYRDGLEKSKAVKTRAQSAVVAAVVFLACRQMGYPRTFKEIRAYVPQARVKDIGRIYKAIVADLKLKEQGEFRSEVVSIHPENFLRRFMSTVGFSNVDMMAAIALANVIKPQGEGQVDQKWHGKSPITIAGTIMWVMSMLNKASADKKSPTLQDICAVCGVAEQTVLNLLKEIKPFLPSMIQEAGGFATSEDITKALGTDDVTKT